MKEEYPDLIIKEVSVNNPETLINRVISDNLNFDLVITPDYPIIEGRLMPDYLPWDIRFGHCAMVLSYTKNSPYAEIINTDNWFKILNYKNVSYGIINPENNVMGQRSLVTLYLADEYYNQPVFSSLLPPETNITAITNSDREVISAFNIKNTDKIKFLNESGYMISDLKNGTINYAWTYRGGAYQNNLSFLDLPSEIDLSNSKYYEKYEKIEIQTSEGVNNSTPIVFIVSIPNNAKNLKASLNFVKLILSREGETAISDLGQIPIKPLETNGNIPNELKGIITP
jgi:molybdate/tungstate transport system substrate-binding protein